METREALSVFRAGVGAWKPTEMRVIVQHPAVPVPLPKPQNKFGEMHLPHICLFREVLEPSTKGSMAQRAACFLGTLADQGHLTPASLPAKRSRSARPGASPSLWRLLLHPEPLGGMLSLRLHQALANLQGV